MEQSSKKRKQHSPTTQLLKKTRIESVKIENVDLKFDTDTLLSDMQEEPVSLLSVTTDDKAEQQQINDTQTLQTEPKLQSWNSALDISLEQLKLHSTTTKRNRIIPSKLDVMTSNETKLKFWWFDAHQHYKKGLIYLFGKVFDHTTNQYASCCVIVENLLQTIFVLPRTYLLDEENENSQRQIVDISDVQNEFAQVLERYNIRDWKCKIRERKYAFGLENVPTTANYLKIQYSFQEPKLPSNINGLTYSHVFGTNTSPLEHFLIKRRIKGPQWLEITQPKFIDEAKETWCRYEFTVNNPKCVSPIQNHQDHSVLNTPPLSVMSLNIDTMMNTNSLGYEIIAAAVLHFPKVKIDEISQLEHLENSRFVVTRPYGNLTSYSHSDLVDALKKQHDRGLPIKIEQSEYALLNYICSKIHILDPDVIVGHGLSRFTLNALFNRMKECDIPFWHKVGRLCWKKMPKLEADFGTTPFSAAKEKTLLTGRLICDTFTACKDLIQTNSYHLSALAESQLGIQRQTGSIHNMTNIPLDGSHIPTILLATHCWLDAYLVMGLLFKFQILPLSKKLTNIAGNLWSKSLEFSRMNRNEYLLLHEFHQQKYICPDKSFQDTQGVELEGMEEEDEYGNEPTPPPSLIKAKKGPAFTGGLLLEPKIGYHDRFVVLLDFNSLYPTIIQEFNICFTTVQLKKVDEECISILPNAGTPTGVLPRLMSRFVQERRKVKERMKSPNLDENKRMQYDIEQNALKLTANSLYGSLGSDFSRFTAKHLAAMVTAQGRSILRDTVDSVEHHLELDVVYGDTDSIMVATHEDSLEKAQLVARKIQDHINGRYKLLELGIDGYFKRLLVLGKKSYAPLIMTKSMENPDIWLEEIKPKGSNILRRDLSELSIYATGCVLRIILSDEVNKLDSIHNFLKKTRSKVCTKKLPIEKFVIHKQLTKNIDDYTSAKGQAHVQVALKMKQNGRIVKGGDTISYVVCIAEDEENVAMVDKVAFPEEAKLGDRIIDINWYLQYELLPSVTRLCQPLMDTNGFAECLGLKMGNNSKREKQLQKIRQQRQHIQSLNETTPMKKLDRMKQVRAFRVQCQHCQTNVKVPGYARYLVSDQIWVCGLQCPKCQYMMSTASIATQLELAIRYFIGLYYEGWFYCQDCEYQTKDGTTMQCKITEGCNGSLTREYTADMLYGQLLYFKGLFDIKKDEDVLSLDDEEKTKQTIAEQYSEVFDILNRIIQRYLDQCAYRFVNMNTFIETYDFIQ
ncbi:uncharacterized protein BX664DRAFT_275449 [Halteromyces radiatus]|uniref:uncharacterized protein n=1 Tax=Halteromyces radiatus TaxID=101107 RepID=UPI00221E492F|nr:uncharacterized protein BX664DRAFT_275449 [Halteromyces radiatus]KAI8097000.1 hypothetical protein BX664DRAFT_275449 [Halteromyces radiatus]